MLRRMTALLLVSLLLPVLSGTRAHAQQKREPVRPIPPPGIDVPASVRTQLNKKRGDLNRKIAALEKRHNPEVDALLPDVEIFSRAVQLALDEGTFYVEGDFKKAEELLDLGLARATELMKGTPGWTRQTGLVVRGYRSRLDDTVQPYGLVIGKEAPLEGTAPLRCDIWFRGRAEKSPELQFLSDRLAREGEYTLERGIVLHPLGRFCNANRFAGEVDVFEALENVRQRYHIDPDRISVRGFSMGGAACWGFTVHYPSDWFASNPGAGFSETAQFLGLDKDPSLLPPWYQQKLWNLYDAHVVAENLFNVPTIVYSGEIDRQKQASDVMVAAARQHGLELTHIIGPQTAHKLHPDSKQIIAARLEELAQQGRVHTPPSIRFSTFTLKYNRCAWVVINGLEEHWREASIHADLEGPEGMRTGIKLKTSNVTELALQFSSPDSPFAADAPVAVTIDDQKIPGVKSLADKSVAVELHKQDGKWQLGAAVHSSLVKRHNLQGPVDDALMDSFLFVRPTGTAVNDAVGKWATSEFDRAVREWRRQMRGEARIKKDVDVTNEDIRNCNLILWGCPSSNSVMKKIASQLPIQWTASELSAGAQKFDPARHAPILVYPNPLNPDRYVVLNSSFTYREFDYLNNARQTPKLPDWAIVDLSVPPDEYAPGKVVAADFFDEQWKLKPAAPAP